MFLLRLVKSNKIGKTYYKKHRCKCQDCQRQFVGKRTYLGLSKEQKRLIENLLLERICLSGICRVLAMINFTPIWIRSMNMSPMINEHVPNNLYAQIPAGLGQISLKGFEIEADPAWSFVGSKSNKVWIWVAMHRASRQSIDLHVGNLHVGDRDGESAQKRWESIAEKIRAKATVYTHDWQAYK